MTDEEISKKWVNYHYDPAVKLTRHSLERAFLAGLEAGKEKAKKEIEEEFLKCYQGYSENISEE